MTAMIEAARRAYEAGDLVRWAAAHLPCPDPMNDFERDQNDYARNQARWFPERYLANLTPDGWRAERRNVR